jgi:hypothetical protein
MFVVFTKPPVQKHRSMHSFPRFTDLIELDGPWEVTFDTAWGGAGRMQFRHLDDWSKREEDGVKYFSGEATYKKVFDLPAKVRATGSDAGNTSSDVWLDLGEVKNLAGVRLNGRDVGIFWTAPWRANVSSAIRSKDNILEISVANLWRNRLVGDKHLQQDAEFAEGGNILRWPEWLVKGEPRPISGRYSFTTWRHFTGDSPLLPSGLMGPVRILQSHP